MSEDDEVYSEEEEEEEEEEKHEEEKKDGGAPDFLKQRAEAKRADIDEQIKEYVEEWRKQRVKEMEELKRLKERQIKRKAQRAEEEKKLEEMKRKEELRRQKEMEEKKQREAEEKKKRLEEIEKKRQAMFQTKESQNFRPNYKIEKRDSSGNIAPSTFAADDPRAEFMKSKEQLEEDKKIALQFRIKPLNIDSLGLPQLKAKAQELWTMIVKLETEKYDLEERQKRQDYDLKELHERQKQQLRLKAIRLGLEPEALTGKHPPKVKVASKHERRVDSRTFTDKKDLFMGGLENQDKETMENAWKEKMTQFDQRSKGRLPKWFGERPGKKQDEPDTPENEEEKGQELDLDSLKPLNFEDEDKHEEEEEEEEEPEEEEEEEEEEEDD